MGIRHHLIAAAVIGVQAIVGWLAAHNYRKLPELRRTPGPRTGHGRVTIVVPARNEAGRLPALLRSLAGLSYRDTEVIVVDDGSEDATRELARESHVRVVHVPQPPPGWTGKNYACQVGADAGSGEWLLFTDADTIHGPDSLDLALGLAANRNAGLVSLLPRQRCETFWERLLLPYSYALYFAGAYRVNQPGGPAIANGQYLLFRREAYMQVGGHAAVRASVIEDVSLARLASCHGSPVILARAEQDVEVRMYENLSSLWEGLSKNAFRFVSVSPQTGIPTILASLAIGSALPVAVPRQPLLVRVGLFVAPAVALIPWVRRFGAPGYFALLHPLAALTFQILALDSIYRTVSGRARWKGRTY